LQTSVSEQNFLVMSVLIFSWVKQDSPPLLLFCQTLILIRLFH